MRKCLIGLAALSFVASASAQTDSVSNKIGFADIDYIFSQMPEAKQIEVDLQSLQSQLKKQLDTKIDEFQKKLTEYRQYGNTVPDAVRQNTERELQQMNDNIERLQQESQENLQKKNTELMQPVYVKVGKAISDVAKEQGYTLVMSSQIGGIDVVLFGDPRVDISDLVLKKMGITPQASITPKAQN